MPVNENRFGLIDFPILTSSARCFTSFPMKFFRPRNKLTVRFPSQDQSRVYYIIIDMRPCVIAIKSRASPLGGCHCFAFFMSCNFSFLFLRPAQCFWPLVYFMGHSRAQPDLSGRKKKQKTMAKNKTGCVVVPVGVSSLPLRCGIYWAPICTHAIQSVTCVCM